MIIYIDRSAVPDRENISNEVFKYILTKALPEIRRYESLYDDYLGRNNSVQTRKNEVKVNINYVKYVVDIVRAFYLGEPVKYDNNDEIKAKTAFSAGTQVKVGKDGKIVRHDPYAIAPRKLDIRPILDTYDRQGIANTDLKIGKYIALFGEAQELIYASDDEVPYPKSYVFKPWECVLVQDNTVEHRDLFFMTFEKRERVRTEQKYWAVTVYTDKTQRYYESGDLRNFYFTAYEPKDIYFGAVPVVNYENDDERQGDAEQLVPLSHAYSELMSDSLTDKKKFIDSLLAVYGAQLPDTEDGEGASEQLKDSKMIDGLPTDARIEYIQKTFDEASIKLLRDDLLREIHKMSMTVDMSDEAFSGNITGVALNMKFMPMSFLAKNKIRSMDSGLKRRFELYNNFLNVSAGVPIVPISEIDVVFTVDMPSNLSETVDTVQKLEGRVDEKTLLSLLPFVKDPDEMEKIMDSKRKESKREFLDSFSSTGETDDSFKKEERASESDEEE